MSDNTAPPGTTSPRRDGLAAPPYRIHAARNFWIGVRFDAAAIRAILPRGLTPATGATGGVGVSLAGPEEASEVTGAWVYVDVEGFDAPDDRPGRFHVAEFFRPPYLAFSRANFSRYAEVVSGHAAREGNMFTASVGPPGSPLLAMKAVIRPNDETADVSFTLNTLSVLESGQITFAPVPTFVRRRLTAEPMAVALAGPPGHPPHSLAPLEAVWAAYNFDINFTAGLARPLAGGLPPALEGVLLLLSQLGKGSVDRGNRAGSFRQ